MWVGVSIWLYVIFERFFKPNTIYPQFWLNLEPTFWLVDDLLYLHQEQMIAYANTWGLAEQCDSSESKIKW